MPMVENVFDLLTRLGNAVEFTAALIKTYLELVMATPEGREFVESIAAPGHMVLQVFGMRAEAGWPLLLAFLSGWWCWVRLLRGLYFTIGRRFGIAGISQYAAWTYLWLPWQKPYKGLLTARRFLRQRVFHLGPAQRWAGFLELAAHPFNARKGDILIGRLPLMQRFGLHMPVGLPDGDKSIALISYAGGGKTAFLHAVLGSMPPEQAAFVFDVDGAMYNALAEHLERQGHAVSKIDVDGIARRLASGLAKCRWNPVYELTVAATRHGNAVVFAFAKILAEALITHDSKSQPVFVNTARIIVTTLILYCWLVEEDKSLVRVMQLLTRGLPEAIESDDETGFSRLLFEMSALGAPREDGSRFDDGCDGALCNAIANSIGLLEQSGQSHSSSGDAPDNFRKTAIAQLSWVDDPLVVQTIGGKSDIVCERLKLSNDVVFFVATLSDTQQRLAPLIRSFLAMSMYAFQRTEPEMQLKYPCNFICDEFANIGRLEIAALSLPGFRKFGARWITVAQSIELLARTYPQEHKEFLNQSAAVIWMGIAPTDGATLTYLSRTVLGEAMRKEKIDGYHWLIRAASRLIGIKNLPPARYQRVVRPLMTPQQCSEFLDRATGQIIVTREGKAPMRLKRLVYWHELPVWRYAVHKGHGEGFLRSCTRRVLTLAQGKLS